MMDQKQTIFGNYYNKYDSKNPIERFLVKNYERVFKNIVGLLEVKNAYEVGSGEGVLLKWVRDVRPDIKIFGSDISPILNSSIFKNSTAVPPYIINRVENLPFSSNSFDLIIACEVLEHLDNPSLCMLEFQRLAAKNYLLSVPNAYLWNSLNILRLKYLKDKGNTPGHLHHWTRNSFITFVSGYLDVQYSIYSQPWVFVLAAGNQRLRTVK